MKGFLRETYNYAILLVILLGIASIAVWETLDYLHDRLDASEYGIVAMLIWALTLGFMLISGAFGLFATQVSAQAESKRRIGRIVDSMDYIHDGLMAVDRKGRVTGLNPAARQLVSLPEARHISVRTIFPCLSDSDAEQLVRSREPVELERSHSCRGTTCMLRFRSQPSEGLVLLLISDVTALTAQRRHNRQVVRLQLIGQIARGVAHDFNNILCAISGNASLLQRVPAGSIGAQPFLEAISRSVERGSAMATHLLELARTVAGVDAGSAEHESLRNAVDALQNSLPPSWSVESQIEKMPPSSLTEGQIEQVVLNIGLHIAEALSSPGVLHAYGGPPSKVHEALTAGDKYSGVVLLSANDIGQILQAGVALQQRELSESGVILSVVRTLVEEAGGAVDCLTAASGILMYRILLPRATEKPAGQGAPMGGDVPNELASLVNRWKLLHARAPGRAGPVDHLIDRLGLETKRVESVAAVLSEISGAVAFQALLIDKALLAREGPGILRAVLRLMPSTGVVVLGEGGSVLLGETGKDVIALPQPPDPRNLLVAMIEAHSLAARRK